MKEQQWKKQVTVRLSDGFYMYKKVLAPRDDTRLTRNQAAQMNEIPTRNHNEQTLQSGANSNKEDCLNRALSQPIVPLLMTPKCPVPDKKSFIGVATPGRPIPSDVSTPVSLSELHKYLAKPSEEEAVEEKGQQVLEVVKEKAQQVLSPYLGPNAMSLAKQLMKDARKAKKRRRRREKKMEKNKRRRKVITRHSSIPIPSFPLPLLEDIRRRFAYTEEARLAMSNSKNAFIHLTNMFVGVQKESITKVYSDEGPFAFIAKACVATLGIFSEKMVVKSEDSGIAKFDRVSKKRPRELELINALKCIRERHEKVRAEVFKMTELKEKIAGGLLEVSVCERVYPLPQPDPERAEFAKEELVQNENLQRSHNSFSEIITENLTVKLTERWLRFKEVSKERQEQLTMSEVYDSEIASAVLPTVRSIVESLSLI